MIEVAAYAPYDSPLLLVITPILIVLVIYMEAVVEITWRLATLRGRRRREREHQETLRKSKVQREALELGELSPLQKAHAERLRQMIAPAPRASRKHR